MRSPPGVGRLVREKVNKGVKVIRAKHAIDFTRYYIGVYLDGERRVLQVTDDIDCLSCEILATPLTQVDYRGVKWMLPSVKELARLHGCQRLEINCSTGKGSYRWLKV